MYISKRSVSLENIHVKITKNKLLKMAKSHAIRPWCHQSVFYIHYSQNLQQILHSKWAFSRLPGVSQSLIHSSDNDESSLDCKRLICTCKTKVKQTLTYHCGYFCFVFLFNHVLFWICCSSHKCSPRRHHYLHFLSHPILPLVAPLPPSRASSWLMSSLGPQLCQGAWCCSGPNQEDIRGPLVLIGHRLWSLEVGQKSLRMSQVDI